MPQPLLPEPLGFHAKNTSAGTTMPPTAAKSGKLAARRSMSSPSVSSRFTSRPTTKKKIAISPSFTQWPRLSAIENCPSVAVTS